MKNQVKFFRSATLICLFIYSFRVAAQDPGDATAVYFESAKSKLNSKAIDEIQQWLVDQPGGCVVHISGNTDARGSDQYNLELAEDRCESVRDYLISAGLAPEEVVIEALGESKPLADNETDKGKQLNRRVDIRMECPESATASVEASAGGESLKSADDLKKLMALLATTPQKFSIDPKQDTSIVCEEGTVLYFRANSLALPSSHSGNVDIEVRENYSKSSMICDNLATQSGNGILETGGMVEVMAYDKSGQAIRMKMKDGMTTFVPTTEMNPSMDVFDGKRHGTRKTAKWKQRSTGNLQPFSYSDIMDCSGYWKYSRKYCNLWCRTKSLFTTSAVRKSSINGSTRRWKSRCEVKKELVRKYGVKDYDAVLEAMNRDLYASMNVTNQAEYLAALKTRQDSLTKWKKEDIEASVAEGSATSEDLQYYVFSNSTFGYYNCDYFMNLPANEVISLNIPNSGGEATYLSLVFEKRNAILSPEYREKSFYFKKVKEDVYATIVAIRSSNGQPQLAMHRFKVSKDIPELVFEDVSVEMLKQKLLELNGEDSSTAMK